MLSTSFQSRPRVRPIRTVRTNEVHRNQGARRAGLAKKRGRPRELFNLRLQMATSQLDSTLRVRAVKRDIARVQTEMRTRQVRKHPQSRTRSREISYGRRPKAEMRVRFVPDCRLHLWRQNDYGRITCRKHHPKYGKMMTIGGFTFTMRTTRLVWSDTVRVIFGDSIFFPRPSVGVSQAR